MKIAASVFSCAVVVLFATASLAQTPPPDTLTWKRKFNFAINFNQASFSSNWIGGGINSLGFNSQFNYKANYKEGRRSWDNELDMGFGFVNNSGQGYRKTIDRIYYDTKYGYDMSKWWALFGAVNFITQFDDGYFYAEDGTTQLTSDFLAPAFLTTAWGMEYHPTDFFKVRLSPFAPRLTVVRNPERFVAAIGEKPYGVDPPETTRMEWLAFQLLADFDKEILTNVNLKWRYIMFANYETFSGQTVDHRLDLNIVAKVNKFINVGLGGILLYDIDQDPGAQYSQMFSFGFLYTFQNYEDPPPAP